MAIIGKHVILRDERQDTDDEDLFRWLNLEEWLYYDSPCMYFEPVSRGEFARRRRRRPEKPAAGTRSWEIDTIEGKHIGSTRYYRLNEQEGHAYLGISLPEASNWGKGYGTEALRLLIGYLLSEMALKELRAATWTGNRRMVRCAEKCGFKEVGRTPHREKLSIRGESLERVEFSITRLEWLALNMKTTPDKPQ